MSSLQALQVLLVDDNQHMRQITSAVLQSAGVRKVREAADGGAALEILRAQSVDLAIVDFNMFPLDGVEFTRLVRNSPDTANPYLPIIMMTGHSEKSRVYEARDAGVGDAAAVKEARMKLGEARKQLQENREERRKNARVAVSASTRSPAPS